MRIFFNNLPWRLFFTTMGLVFLSEMGDKTQITTLLLAGAKPAHVLWVGLGSATALICTSLLEVIIGSKVIASYIKPSALRVVSGAAFIVMGILLALGLWGGCR
ncbi:MAG: TMEM165/GDT1 family protein [Thermacetogeniaceae bacterium]